MNKDCIHIMKLNKTYIFSDSSQSFFKRIFTNKKIEVHAVKNFSMNVKDGEIIGLLGMNGAGKTSLIKMLTGIMTPSSGDINILGYSPSKDRYDYTFNIGVVMGQKSLLWNNIPVIESFKLYKNIYEISDSMYDERIEEFESIFNIKELLNKPVRKLSLGQRMKCEIAASLLHNPKVLFLDEPTLGLDIISKNQIYEMLIKMNRQLNTTILLTTHNLNDIDALCERIVLIDKGEKIYDGKKSLLIALDNSKKIIITGSFEQIQEELKAYKKIDENKYSITCAREELSSHLKIISEIKGIEDIQIYGRELESIVESIYKGEINI